MNLSNEATQVTKPEKRKRSRFLNFGLRSLFVLVLVVAGALAYLVPKIEEANKEQETIDWLASKGVPMGSNLLSGEFYYRFDYDYQIAEQGKNTNALQIKRAFTGSPQQRSPNGPWLIRKLFGEHVFSRVKSVGVVLVPHSDIADSFFKSLESFRDLEKIDVSDAAEITDLSHFTGFEKLRTLKLSQTDLKTLSNVESLEKLETLILERAKFDSLGKIDQLKDLKQLTLRDCSNLNSAKQLAKLNQLRTLHLTDNQLLNNYDFLKGMTGLTELRIEAGYNNKIFDMSCLANCKQLTTLTLSDFEEIENPEQIRNLTKLKGLNLSGTHSLKSLDGFESLTKLQILYLHRNFFLQDISAIKVLEDLRELSLEFCLALDDLEPISELAKLDTLKIGGSENLQNLKPIRNLNELSHLNLTFFRALEDVSDIQSLNLRTFAMARCHKVGSLKALKHMTKLQRVKIEECDGLKAMDGVGSQPKLNLVEVTNCYELTNVDSLAELANQTTNKSPVISINDCDQLPPESIDQLEEKLKNSKVTIR